MGSIMSEELKQILKKLEEIDTSLLMLIFQNMELNALFRKLNYISGADYELTMSEFQREVDYLTKMINCIKGKGELCPIKGIKRKFGRVVNEQEDGE